MIKQSLVKNAAYELFFASLSNPNRLAILNTIRKKSLNVSEICINTGFEQTMVSHNLKRLQRCGMVFAEKKGKFKFYRVNNESIEPILSLIDKHMNRYCCKILEEECK